MRNLCFTPSLSKFNKNCLYQEKWGILSSVNFLVIYDLGSLILLLTGYDFVAVAEGIYGCQSEPLLMFLAKIAGMAVNEKIHTHFFTIKIMKLLCF